MVEYPEFSDGEIVTANDLNGLRDYVVDRSHADLTP
jgi:hypothetical protein